MKYLAPVAVGAGTEELDLVLVDLMLVLDDLTEVDKVVLVVALLVVVAETVTGLDVVVTTAAEVGLGTHWSGCWLVMVRRISTAVEKEEVSLTVVVVIRRASSYRGARRAGRLPSDTSTLSPQWDISSDC